jgi:uncharacterized membrane protein
VVIRYLNFYGEKPWVHTGDSLRTFMSFMSAKKYPPTLMFLLPTLGLGLILLAFFEKIQNQRIAEIFAVLGGAPMFFYLLHLYVLKAMYLVSVHTWGANQGQYYGFDSLAGIWLWWAILGLVLYWPTRWFSKMKQRRKDIWWLKYL